MMWSARAFNQEFFCYRIKLVHLKDYVTRSFFKKEFSTKQEFIELVKSNLHNCF